jgi:hypothetical protein
MMSMKEFAAFEALDLAPIKMKLMHVESGEGWSALRADAVETEYRRFLFLMKKYPDANASPTVDVDTFWHYHILDTLKYARDCEALFGYFLHHYPYVGIGADANDGDHAAGGARMHAIYEAEFGVPREAADAAYAYCATPGKPREAAGAAGAAYAYCATPGKPREAANAAYAYCATPGKPREAADAAYAYCATPGKPREAANTAYAYCASPGKPCEAFDAAYAYCALPGEPREAANSAYAYCATPGKPSQSDATEHSASQAQELAHAA